MPRKKAKAEKPQRKKRVPKVKPVRLDGVFTPEGKLVCPRCFSKADVAARQEKALSTSRGWGVSLTDAKITVDKKVHGVMESKYPCANRECPVEMVVRFTTALTFPPALRKPMTKEQAAKYATGAHDKQGVWTSGLTPPQPKEAVAPQEIVVRKAKSPPSKTTKRGKTKKK